jgi:hypothetical protein
MTTLVVAALAVVAPVNATAIAANAQIDLFMSLPSGGRRTPQILHHFSRRLKSLECGVEAGPWKDDELVSPGGLAADPVRGFPFPANSDPRRLGEVERDLAAVDRQDVAFDRVDRLGPHSAGCNLACLESGLSLPEGHG